MAERVPDETGGAPIGAVCSTVRGSLGTWGSRSLPVMVPVVLSLSLGLYRIGAHELIDDELCTWWAVHLSFADFLALVRNVDAVLAPYYLFMRVWCRLFGDSEWLLRLPSVLAMAASAGLLSVLGQRLFDRRTGLVSGLTFAVIPSVVRFSQDARPYALATLCAIGSTLVLLYTLQKPSERRRWGYYAVAVALTGMTHLVSLGVLGAHFAFLFERRRDWPWFTARRATFGPWLVAVTVALLAVLPIVLLGAHQDEQLRRIELVPRMFLALPCTVTLSSRIGYGLAGLALLSVSMRTKSSLRLSMWAILPPLFTYATYDALHVFRARYLIFTLPAWSLLAASACTRLRLLSRWPLLAGVVATVAYVAAVPIERVWQLQDPDSSHYGCPSRILAQFVRRDDVLIYGGLGAAREHTRIGLTYGLRHSLQPRDALVQRSAASLGGFRAQECSSFDACLPSDAQRVWFIFPDSMDERMDRVTAKLTAQMEAAFVRSNSWPCGKRRLDLFVRKGTAATH
ncbi:MAG: glycosyltransferase family 39 protein [Polyangiaceae bacterium]